jgi:hypothetical protein
MGRNFGSALYRDPLLAGEAQLPPLQVLPSFSQFYGVLRCRDQLEEGFDYQAPSFSSTFASIHQHRAVRSVCRAVVNVSYHGGRRAHVYN